jgi:hypothetical protein
LLKLEKEGYGEGEYNESLTAFAAGFGRELGDFYSMKSQTDTKHGESKEFSYGSGFNITLSAGKGSGGGKASAQLTPIKVNYSRTFTDSESKTKTVQYNDASEFVKAYIDEGVRAGKSSAEIMDGLRNGLLGKND